MKVFMCNLKKQSMNSKELMEYSILNFIKEFKNLLSILMKTTLCILSKNYSIKMVLKFAKKKESKEEDLFLNEGLSSSKSPDSSGDSNYISLE